MLSCRSYYQQLENSTRGLVILRLRDQMHPELEQVPTRAEDNLLWQMRKSL